jgi:hypothetical protein
MSDHNAGRVAYYAEYSQYSIITTAGPEHAGYVPGPGSRIPAGRSRDAWRQWQWQRVFLATLALHACRHVGAAARRTDRPPAARLLAGIHQASLFLLCKKY